MDHIDYNRFKNKDLLELAYKNRYMFGKVLEKNGSELIKKISDENISRERKNSNILNYNSVETEIVDTNSLKKLEELKKKILFEEDEIISIEGVNYLLDKSQSELYNINNDNGYKKRGNYVGKLMPEDMINRELPKNEQIINIEVENQNKTKTKNEYFLQNETRNLYEVYKDPYSDLKIKGKFVGILTHDNKLNRNEQEVILQPESNHFFIYLSGYEKKMLVYIIDYFFNYKYNGLRNIILNSIYNNKFYKNEIEESNYSYAISLDIEIDLCKLFIHMHLFTKYKKVIDTCEIMIKKKKKNKQT